MTPQRFIETKRDGRRHSDQELKWFADAAASGEIGDDQIGAWLMAAYLHPLSPEETVALTLAMAESGERLDLSSLPKPWVDKHSTGGVGDKTSLVVLPLLAACGLTMVKMSGRGLGMTGGTIDKLSSIPGLKLSLSKEEMIAQAAKVGLALGEQTANLAPADKKLYSIRDATATTGSIPLIVSSILSKKLAAGAELVSLDVKAGSGAFMPDLRSAKTLARSLKLTAEACGLRVIAEITDMSQPLGTAIGNALEVDEAMRVLAGETGRFRELCLALAGHTLEAVGRPAAMAAEALDSGAALAKAKEWLGAQGAAASFLDGSKPLEIAPVRKELLADRRGFVERLDAATIGHAVADVGGGRRRKEDAIDYGVGVLMSRAVGDQVERGDLLMTVVARTDSDAEKALELLRKGVSICEGYVQAPPLVWAEL